MKRTVILAAVAAVAVMTPLAPGEQTAKPAGVTTQPAGPTTQPTSAAAFENEWDSISYMIGVQIGRRFKAEGLKINPSVFARALDDVLNDRPLAISDEQMKQAMDAFRKAVEARQQAMLEDQKRQQEKNLAEAKAFLAENAKKEGVKVLPSGLQYKVIKEGTGRKPTQDDKVRVQYKGTLLSGKEFDSSYRRGRPAEFTVGGVIKGWQEALSLMKEGAKWQLFIPPDLAYGPNGAGGVIPPNAALIFDVELLKIVTPDE